MALDQGGYGVVSLTVTGKSVVTKVWSPFVPPQPRPTGESTSACTARSSPHYLPSPWKRTDSDRRSSKSHRSVSAAGSYPGAGSVNWFDTAEVYGRGASERSLVSALETAGVNREEYLIVDKWFPAFRFAGNISKSFDNREEALGGAANG